VQVAVDKLYDQTVMIDDLIAKALKLTEVARIARTETTLRRYINSKWNARMRRATKKAVSMAKDLKPASQISKAIDKEMSKWAGDIEKKFLEAVEKMYRNARIAGWKKATKQTRARLTYEVPSFTEEVKKQRPVAEVLPSFDLVDEEAVEALQDHQLFWIGDHYEENVSASIAATTKETMVEAGKDRRVAGKLMATRVKDTLEHVRTPGGWHGSSRQYFEGLVANAATVARAHGQTRSFQAAMVTRAEVTNPVDERTCFCENTLILMEGGSWKPIQDIKVGQRVMTRQGRSREVLQRVVKSSSNWVRVSLFGGGFLECTEDHLLALFGGGWIKAGKSGRAWVEFFSTQRKSGLSTLRQEIQSSQLPLKGENCVLFNKLSEISYPSGTNMRFMWKDFYPRKKSCSVKDKLLFTRMFVSRKERRKNRLQVFRLRGDLQDSGQDRRGSQKETLLFFSLQNTPCEKRDCLQELRQEIFQMEKPIRCSEAGRKLLFTGLSKELDLDRGSLRSMQKNIQTTSLSQVAKKTVLLTGMQAESFDDKIKLQNLRQRVCGKHLQARSQILFRQVREEVVGRAESNQSLPMLQEKVCSFESNRRSLSALFCRMPSKGREERIHRRRTDKNMSRVWKDFSSQSDGGRETKALFGTLQASSYNEQMSDLWERIPGLSWSSKDPSLLLICLLSEESKANKYRDRSQAVSSEGQNQIRTGSESRETVGCRFPDSIPKHSNRSGWDLLALKTRSTGTRREKRKISDQERLQTHQTCGEGSQKRGKEDCLFIKGFVQVESVEFFKKEQLAYDIEVEEDHSYIVAPGVAVHNCPVCSHLNGKIFEVRHLVDNMEEELAAETKDAVKKAHPWMSISKLKGLSPRAGNVSAADSASLAKAGIAQPPYHFRCRCVLDISVEAGSWEPL